MTQQLRDQLQATLSGSYTIERELGGGGMSKVFVAEELRLRRKVVVKVLSPELAQGISVERFEREIQTAAALQQANIVPILSAGDTNGLPFYTMPFVDGESLRARLGRGPLAVTEVIGVLRDVSKALAYAHQHGVVHRDIKPDNVLISGGTAVVTDFGIAKAISAARTDLGNATLTQVGTSIGTPAYMSPEQAAGDPQIDHRADIYSLGAMAYELLSGQAVFANRTPQRMLAAHMSETPKPITEFRGDLPSALAEIVMQCLAKEAKDRPQQASDIARVLDTITSGSGMQSMPPVLLGGPGMLKKALAIYAAAFVAVALLAKAAIVVIGLPDWVFPGALIVMALGLPVVLWTGYVQRVTRRAMTITPTFTPGGSPVMSGGTIATMALKAAPKMSWSRTARGGVYAFGAFIVLIAAFMAMRAFGVGPFGSLVASGKLNAKDPLLLTDFRMINADSSLGRVVSDAVRAGLGESRVLSVMSAARVSEALGRMQQPRNVRIDLALARNLAVREGVKAIVDGDVTGVGTGYIVQLRLVSADSGTELASFRETGDGPRGLIDAADNLARALRGKAGESLRAVHSSPPLAEVTTSSLEALRHYTDANRATGEGRWDDAARLARQAIALDSGFALAYRHLSEALINGRLAGPASDSAITRAFQLRDRLSERERLAVIGDYYYNGPGRDRGKAIEAFEQEVKLGSYANTNSLGQALARRRDFALAESLGLVRMRVEPERVITYSNVASWRLSQGRAAAAESALDASRSIRRTPERGTEILLRAGIAMTRGDLPAARILIDSVVRTGAPPERLAAWGNQAAALRLIGRLDDAARSDRAARAFAVTRGTAVNPIPDSVHAIVRDAQLFGASPDHLKRLDAVVASAGLTASRSHLMVAEAFASTGHPQKARAILARFETDVRDTAFKRAAQPDLHNVQAAIALAERRIPEALAEYRKGDLLPDGPATSCVGCLAANLARVFDAAGEADSVIVQLEALLRAPPVARLGAWNMALVGQSEQRLAELYDAKGNAAKAAEHYRKFIDLWKNADPELQPQVAEARRRLAKLAPVEKPR